MPSFTISSLALLIALTTANPVLIPSKVLPQENPSKIFPRDNPAPSTYPPGDPCVHEWKYLNFNKDSETDKSRLQKLHQIICSGEMRALSSYAQGSAKDGSAPYRRYFVLNDPDDEQDKTQQNIEELFSLITGKDSTDGAIGSIVESFVVDNNDFGAGNEDYPTCDDAGTYAYTLFDEGEGRDGLEKIHFCDAAYTLGYAGDVDCNKLDPYPSTKMDSFSRIALHEMVHYSTMGPAHGLEEQIIDAKNADGEYAYEPERCHGLVDEDQDDQPGLAEINADSYAWLGLDAWISRKCAADPNEWEGYFTQDPPDYEPEED